MSRLNYAQQSPEVFKALMGIEKAISQTATLEKGLMDLVKIRASQLNGCLFCNDIHSKEAKIHGERELRLYHLAFWHESSLFTDRERAALRWTELLTKISSHGVEDEDFKQVRAHFNEKELSDLTLVISTINSWNRLGVAFRPEAGGMDKMMGLEKAGLN